MSVTKKPYKGCRDFFPTDMRLREFLFSAMKRSAEIYAFEPYDGPLLEALDLYLAKSGEELINEQLYSFTDRGNRQIAIRPEMTPTVARMVSNIHRETSKPIRWYSIPNLMRYEKPQRGRLREHWQFNADIFGAPEGLGELEVLDLIVHFMRSFGADESMFSIQLNDRKIVDLILDDILKLDSEKKYKLYKVIDKSKKVSEEALEKMLVEIFTDEKQKNIFSKYIKLKSFTELASFISEFNMTEQVQTSLDFFSKLSRTELSKFIEYDPAIVRGLDYYTGIVFEVFDKHPDNRRAIAGGGAYANLLQIFNETPLPGVGFGMGDVTLKDFLETHKLLPNFSTAENNLYIAYLDDESEQASFELSQELRLKGLKVELNLGQIKFNKALKNAQTKGHKFMALLGSNEVQAQEINIKNIESKETQTFKLNEIEQIESFLKG